MSRHRSVVGRDSNAAAGISFRHNVSPEGRTRRGPRGRALAARRSCPTDAFRRLGLGWRPSPAFGHFMISVDRHVVSVASRVISVDPRGNWGKVVV